MLKDMRVPYQPHASTREWVWSVSWQFFKEYPTHLACGRFNANPDAIKLLIAKHSLLFEGQKPGVSTFSSYLNDAYAYEAPSNVVYFLRRVVERGNDGYSYLSTREDRFYAVKAPPPTKETQQDKQQSAPSDSTTAAKKDASAKREQMQQSAQDGKDGQQSTEDKEQAEESSKEGEKDKNVKNR